MNRLVFTALSAVGVMSLAAAFLAPQPEAAPAPLPSVAATRVDDNGEDALALTRDSTGQFRVRASVNGSSEVEFMVDTGADLVALTEAEAESLGILPPEHEFQPNMRTASGIAYGAAVKLDEMELAGQQLHGVDAVVVRGLATNLLGQSVLRRLGGVELQGDRMVIRAR